MAGWPAAIPVGRRPALPAGPAPSRSTRAPRRRSLRGAPHHKGLDHPARHGQGQPAQDHRVDADHPSARIGHGAAGITGGEPEIGLDPAGSRVAAKGGRGVHDSGDDRPDQPEGMADRQDQLARAEAIRIADQRRRKVAGPLSAGQDPASGPTRRAWPAVAADPPGPLARQAVPARHRPRRDPIG